ncbi:MAG: DUF3616 domain-containing protein [Ferruginibacter sp.]
MKKSLRTALSILALLIAFTSFSQDQCMPVGWATQNGGVTGGGDVTPVVVSTYNDLKTAITSSTVKVIHISGTITIPSSGRINLQDRSGKTIFGLPGSKLVSADLTAAGSGILYVKRCSNIIFRNITFEGPGAYDMDGNDNMTLETCTNIWVDHCEFQDGMDGNLDIKSASDFVSVTWCKFIYNKAPIPGGTGGSNDHRFCNLLGSGDDAVEDRGKLSVTFQNCWWAQGCKARMPRVRFGKVHIVNNLFNSTAASQCVQAGFEADLLVESNVFENVGSPIDKMANNFTAITARDNIFTGTSGNTTGSGTSFTPPYSLSILPVAVVKTVVSNPACGAGATMTAPGKCGCGIYSLTTNIAPAAAGTVSKSPDNDLYAPDSVVTVTATAALGYEFVNWSGDITGYDAVTTVAMNANKTVTANFQTIQKPVLSADAIQPSYAGTSKPYLSVIAGSKQTAYISGVINDPTDPAATEGLIFTVSSTSAVIQVTSNNTAVVPVNNVVITKASSKTIVKIIPAGVGYATLTLTATNTAGSSEKYTVSYAASAASANPPATQFYTTASDASGASAVDSDYMFVADDESNAIRLYNRHHSGKELYSLDITSAIGAEEECDLEGSSASVKYNAGKRIYWIGSLGNSKSGSLKPDRNKALATDVNGTGAASTLTVKSYSNQMRNALITWGNGNGWNFTAAAAEDMIPKRIDGFNVEGLSITTGGDTAYIGFRAPCVPIKGTAPNSTNRKYALVAPITNFETIMNGSGEVATSPSVSEPILFDLEGLGIRSIERVGNGKYLIVAGLYTGGGTPAVYLWDGVVPANPGINPITTSSSTSKLVKLSLPGLQDLAQTSADGEAEGHPEAMIADVINDVLNIYLISDNGTVDFYNDGKEAKSLARNEFKKFRQDKFTWSLSDAVALNISTAGLGSGTVTLNPAGGTYTPGTVVTVTANATTGSFTGWSGDLTGASNPATIIMNTSKSVTAIFGTGVARKKIAYVTDPNGATYINDTKILPALKADTNLIVTEINGNQTGIDYSPYDCIVFSEVPSSTAAGVLALRGINKPFLMMKVHAYKVASGAWGWAGSTTAYGENTTETNIVVSDKSHPIFTGVNFVNGNEVQMLSSVAASKGITYMNPLLFANPANGTVSSVATVKNNVNQSSILQMPAGTSINGTTVPQDFIQVGINSSSYANVTSDGVKIVLNAVYYLTQLLQKSELNLCPDAATGSFTSNINGGSYQWQWDTCGTGCYVNIANNNYFSGTNTKKLQLSNIPTSFNGYRFRCVSDGSNSNGYTVKFTANWTGAVSNAWEIPGNWECNTVPDEYTDVVIRKGTPVLNSSTTIRSLLAGSTVNITVNSANNLTIKH